MNKNELLAWRAGNMGIIIKPDSEANIKLPTQFGGVATVTKQAGELYETKSGCLWTLEDGVLVSYYE